MLSPPKKLFGRLAVRLSLSTKKHLHFGHELQPVKVDRLRGRTCHQSHFSHSAASITSPLSLAACWCSGSRLLNSSWNCCRLWKEEPYDRPLSDLPPLSLASPGQHCAALGPRSAPACRGTLHIPFCNFFWLLPCKIISEKGMGSASHAFKNGLNLICNGLHPGQISLILFDYGVCRSSFPHEFLKLQNILW